MHFSIPFMLFFAIIFSVSHTVTVSAIPYGCQKPPKVHTPGNHHLKRPSTEKRAFLYNIFTSRGMGVVDTKLHQSDKQRLQHHTHREASIHDHATVLQSRAVPRVQQSIEQAIPEVLADDSSEFDGHAPVISTAPSPHPPPYPASNSRSPSPPPPAYTYTPPPSYHAPEDNCLQGMYWWALAQFCCLYRVEWRD
ncbi:hypothetical protein BC835DRAFT_1342424 [Cytidiella melzeri]|nr:hypothetical protein BC835DRAFT_1342424 [Cytidiella melzeri]